MPTNLRQVQTKKNFSRYQYPLLKFKLEKNHVIYYISKQLKKIRRIIKPVQMNQLNFKPALLHNFPLSTWSSLLSPIIDLNLFFTIFILLNICSPLANVTGIVFANMNALYTKVILFYSSLLERIVGQTQLLFQKLCCFHACKLPQNFLIGLENSEDQILYLAYFN